MRDRYCSAPNRDSVACFRFLDAAKARANLAEADDHRVPLATLIDTFSPRQSRAQIAAWVRFAILTSVEWTSCVLLR